MNKAIKTLSLALIIGLTTTSLAFATDKGCYKNGPFGEIKSLVDSGTSLEDAKTQVLKKINSKIDEDVASGKLTSEKAEKMKSHIAEDIASFDGKTMPKMREKGERIHIRMAIKELVDSGMKFEDAKKKVLQDTTAKIDEMITNNTITADKGNEFKTKITEKINNLTEADLSKIKEQ